MNSFGQPRYSEDKAREEVALMQAKIANEEAESYDEAEKLIPDNFESLDGKPARLLDIEAYKENLANENLLATFEVVTEISEMIKQKGGRGLLIGGSVRDLFVGKLSKDYDLEVYGIDYNDLYMLLKYGLKKDYNFKEVGEAFGVMKLRENGIDIDVSIPRRDSKTGEGHRGISAALDKNMTIKEAAQRRDFTMNTLAMDPLTGEIFDEFGGINDLENRVLKVTDKKLFGDDPLRVLRAMQFVGRFGLTVDEDSKPIIKETSQRLKEISPERFFEEFQKLLLKSEKPSLGLMAAMELDIFKDFFPHFIVMKNTEQERDWHPEGDVWMHTLIVVDEAARIIRQQDLSDKEKMTLMTAALLHDVGKPQTTKLENGRLTSKGHDVAGKKTAEEFLKKINAPKDMAEKVVQLVTNHMAPGDLFRNEQKGVQITDSAIRRLAQRIKPATLEELSLVCSADSFGREGIGDRVNYLPGIWLLKRAKDLKIDKTPPSPLLKGKDLIAAGFKPGKDFSKLIELGDRIRALQEELAIEKPETGQLSKEELMSLIEDLDSATEAIQELRKKAFDTIANIRDLRYKKKGIDKS